MIKKQNAVRGMTPAIIATVIVEIEAYERGERDEKLTWRRIGEFSGFSRVALWQKESIKTAFQRAKYHAKAEATPQVKPPKTTDERIAQMQATVKKLRSIIESYDEQWAAYEYNMHRMGLDPDELRRPLPALQRAVLKSRRRPARSTPWT